MLEYRMISPDDHGSQALQTLTTAVAPLGIGVRTSSPALNTAEANIVLTLDDRQLTVGLVPVSYCTAQWVAPAVAKRDPATAYLVVADRITADARELLTAAGWSWLDRRGRLHLWGPGIRVDVDIAPEVPAPSPRTRPVSGRAGLTVAYWLCSYPGRHLSPTGSRRELRLAPSTISMTVRRLAEAGLVDDDGAGVLPELFWELADVWRPAWTWLIEKPDPPSRSSEDGAWRMTGTPAAAALGAPVVSTESQPSQLYVVGPVEVSIAARAHGLTKPGLGTAAVAVAPTSLVTAGSAIGGGSPEVDGWPVAPKLAVALDLAQDRGRGREVLSDWEAGRGTWL